MSEIGSGGPGEAQIDGLLVAPVAGGVVEIRLDRPERRNALTEAMMVGLGRLGRTLSADADVRAVVLTAAGVGFCAGADRDVVASRQEAQRPYRWPALMGREAELLATFEMPVVAVVQGAAVGLGMGLALAADICVAEPSAYFAEGHLALGLCPTAMTWWLPRLCGLQRAADIVFTGRRVPADEAGRIGIVARLVDDGEGESTALDLARTIAAMPPLTSRYAKRAFQLAQDHGSMLRVREFGGAANVINRSNPTAGQLAG